MGTIGPIRLVVLQPTPYCNLACSYCYLPHRDDRRRMAPDTLDAIARNVIASPLAADEISLVWHAGEPMTLPPAWYEEAFARLAAGGRGRRLRHAFQTNAVGVDDRWTDLWRRWDVSIGVSLDGPADVHDATRLTRSGRGSHALAMEGIRRIREAGIDFHVIAVLTRSALDDPDRMVDFFDGNGIERFCFNVEEREGANAASSLEAAGAETAYRRFLARVAERVAASGGRLRCREVERVRALAAAPARARRFNPEAAPLAIVSIAVDGRMSTFSPELLGLASDDFDDFAFADVHERGPEAILESPAFRRLAADVSAGVSACERTCGYFDVCGGGAPANKLAELGTARGTETMFCRLTRKAALEGVLGALETRVG